MFYSQLELKIFNFYPASPTDITTPTIGTLHIAAAAAGPPTLTTPATAIHKAAAGPVNAQPHMLASKIKGFSILHHTPHKNSIAHLSKSIKKENSSEFIKINVAYYAACPTA